MAARSKSKEGCQKQLTKDCVPNLMLHQPHEFDGQAGERHESAEPEKANTVKAHELTKRRDSWTSDPEKSVVSIIPPYFSLRAIMLLWS